MSLARRTVGHLLSVTGLAALAAAAWLGWSSYQRWSAVTDLARAHDRSQAGRHGDGRALARQAIAGCDGAIAAELAAADPANPDDREHLARLLPRATGDDARALESALDLAAVLAGEKPEAGAQGSDGRLIAAMAAWRAQRPADWPTLDPEEPPSRAVLLAAHAAALVAAVRGDVRAEIRRHAGCLVLLDPRHPWREHLLRLLREGEP
jgi:hypothetical protein